MSRPHRGAPTRAMTSSPSRWSAEVALRALMALIFSWRCVRNGGSPIYHPVTCRSTERRGRALRRPRPSPDVEGILCPRERASSG